MNEGKLTKRLIRLFGRQKIVHKIALGYGLSVGIAVMGASVGLIAGSLYEDQVSRKSDVMSRKATLVRRLENDTLTLALHPQHLLTVVDQSLWLEYEIGQFKSDVTVLRTSITTFENFVSQHQVPYGMGQGLAVIRPLRLFLND